MYERNVRQKEAKERRQERKSNKQILQVASDFIQYTTQLTQ